MVADMKPETDNSKINDMSDKEKHNIRLMKDEHILINRHQTPKKPSLTKLRASLKATQTTMEGRDSNPSKDIPITLSPNNQD